jgi:hypothetical protein
VSKKPTPAEGIVAPPIPEADQAVTTPPTSASTPPTKSQTPAPAVKDERDYNGQLLKELRESAGLTLRELSDKTKITLPILQALEEERFADVPSARVYVRGFVRAVARELNVDMDQASKTYVPRWERWHASLQPELVR